MSNIIDIPIYPISEYRRRCEFHTYQVPIAIHGGKKFPCIALIDIETQLPILFTGYAKYAIDKQEEELSERTLYNRVERISKFMNYLLWNTNYNHLYECTVTDIHDFLNDILTIDGKQSERSTWTKTKGDVFSFLVRYYRNKHKDYPFSYTEDDLINRSPFPVRLEDDIYNFVHDETRYNNLFIKPPRNKTKKNRILLYKHLDILIDTLTIYDQMLVLAVMLQAYAGLRASEVMNLSIDDVTKKYSYGILTSIELDIEERAPFFTESELRTNPGEIKKPRIQKVYDAFLKKVNKAYEEHLQLIYSKKEDVNDDEPLFINEWNKPLTVQDYTERLRKLFRTKFVPKLEEQYENTIGDDIDIAYIEAYRKDYPGSHMLRHWFTMYLIVIAKLPRGEIKTWRGDISEKSMETYMHLYGDFVADYRRSVYSLQNRILHDPQKDD